MNMTIKQIQEVFYKERKELSAHVLDHMALIENDSKSKKMMEQASIRIKAASKKIKSTSSRKADIIEAYKTLQVKKKQVNEIIKHTVIRKEGF